MHHYICKDNARWRTLCTCSPSWRTLCMCARSWQSRLQECADGRPLHLHIRPHHLKKHAHPKITLQSTHVHVVFTCCNTHQILLTPCTHAHEHIHGQIHTKRQTKLHESRASRLGVVSGCAVFRVAGPGCLRGVEADRERGCTRLRGAVGERGRIGGKKCDASAPWPRGVPSLGGLRPMQFTVGLRRLETVSLGGGSYALL